MRFLLLLLALFACLAHADEDLLEPEKAFQYSARLVDEHHVEAVFQIASGYYLYKDKLHFSADAGVKLGKAALPKAKVKQDEYFGKVEYYRGDLRVVLPVSFPGKAVKNFKLKANFQGCADLGVCYPPQEGVLEISASGADPAPAAAAPAPLVQQNPEVLARLKNLAASMTGGSPEPQLLSPEAAFTTTTNSASARSK